MKKASNPGAIPMSEKFLNQEDNDGNQLWAITTMREQTVEYIKVLKKNGYLGQ